MFSQNKQHCSSTWQNVFEIFIFLLNLDEVNQLCKKILLMDRKRVGECIYLKHTWKTWLFSIQYKMHYIPNVIKPTANIYIADVYGWISLFKLKKKKKSFWEKTLICLILVGELCYSLYPFSFPLNETEPWISHSDADCPLCFRSVSLSHAIQQYLCFVLKNKHLLSKILCLCCFSQSYSQIYQREMEWAERNFFGGVYV